MPYEFQSSKTMCKYLKSWHSGYKACTSQKSLYFTSSDSGQEQGRWAPFWCRWSWPTLSSAYSLIWVYAVSLFQTSISSIFMWTFPHYIYFWLVFWKSITCIKWVIICPKVYFSPILTPSFPPRSNTPSETPISFHSFLNLYKHRCQMFLNFCFNHKYFNI